MVDQPNPAASASSHLAEVLELLRKLMDYRSSEVRQRLEKVGRVASMLHMDVLLLIYHFSRASQGNILEIGLTLADPPSRQPLARVIPGHGKR